MSGGFNLSEWALAHRSLVLYAMLVTAILGVLGFSRLGESEDPPFTFKVMVIQTLWPGASAQQVEREVTDRIERKLQETPNVDFLQSYSRPGESMIFFNIKDSASADTVPATWYQVRKRVGDMANELPQGVRGPFFNDEFGDVYTNIYALEGDGYTFAELRDYADELREELLRVPGVAKVNYFGDQTQVIHVEISNRKLATLGITPADIEAVLRAQNAVAAAGSYDTGSDHITLRESGQFRTIESLEQVTFRADGRLLRLGDIAHIYRGYEEPPEQQMRFEGRPVLGIGVTMQAGGNVIQLSKHLRTAIASLQQRLPAGLTLHTVTDGGVSVAHSIDDFQAAVGEAVAIVLVVSLLTLGLRTGMVVVISIPLVLAATAFLMWMLGIGLHKVSLGTLILALGLLVDDAIIAVEMMAVKLEQGFDRIRAAAFTYTSTAFPMLTGTLVTVAGFLPIALAKSSTGEYTRSIFQVAAIALLSSWVAAVVVIPYLGYKILPERDGSGHAGGQNAHDVYDTAFYTRFRRVIRWCVNRRAYVLTAAAGLFLLAVAAFHFIPQQFFPSSSRPELLVDLRLPEGASFQATLAATERMEKFLEAQGSIANYVSYVGTGSPRFYLPLDQQLPQRNFTQFVVTARSVPAREALRTRIMSELAAAFPDVQGRVTRLENGPPVGFPVQFRVSGDNISKVRQIAAQVADVVRADPRATDVQYDWDGPASKTVRLQVDQEKARLLGVSSDQLAQFLEMSLSGYTATYYREGDKLIAVDLRVPPAERASLDNLSSLMIPTAAGKSVPLSQIAQPVYGLEYGVIWERDREPTVIVRADTVGNAQGIDVTDAIDARLASLRAELPLGYRIEVGGAVENNVKAQASINAEMPVMLFAVFTLLMIQLQSFSRTFMVLLTAPLGLVGVAGALLLFHKPFGFVAMLGTIAMLGIIMRNSVILMDQIDRDIRDGADRFQAIVGATVRRFRPITLTAAAAVLALIPLMPDAFFGPMAVALMGGITVATVLTLFFLPALYAAWFRVPADDHVSRAATFAPSIALR
ncbi:MAG TPA: efflux RND transporter permease subunit [Steroidobacteraceae bacterium]|nr:efflux RND transporter permease subunit [Steroidobacteraceae bacterium]